MSYRLVGLMKEIHEEGNMAHRVYAAIPVTGSSDDVAARARDNGG